MISPITRRLLRDWKRLSHQQNGNYHVKPQDSNLHIWHFVLASDSAEIYGMMFVGGSDTEPLLVMRSFTPNGCFPAGKNVSLTHLAPLLLGQGLTGLLDQLQKMVDYTMNIGDLLLMRAWNRVILKEFKNQFPELHAQHPVHAQECAAVQQWAELNARREVPKLANFKFKDLSPATTIACDNEGNDSKRRKLGPSSSQTASRSDSERDSDVERHRKRR